jgi:hypothetical protein
MDNTRPMLVRCSRIPIQSAEVEPQQRRVRRVQPCFVLEEGCSINGEFSVVYKYYTD